MTRTIDDLFPSKYLKSSDLNGDTPLTIKAVVVEDVRERSGDTKEKAVPYFEELEKGLPLNKTNAQMIASLYGKDLDERTGKMITLYVTSVSTPEGLKDGIRVRDSAPQPAQETEIPF